VTSSLGHRAVSAPGCEGEGWARQAGANARTGGVPHSFNRQLEAMQGHTRRINDLGGFQLKGLVFGYGELCAGDEYVGGCAIRR